MSALICLQRIVVATSKPRSTVEVLQIFLVLRSRSCDDIFNRTTKSLNLLEFSLKLWVESNERDHTMTADKINKMGSGIPRFLNRCQAVASL